MDATLHSRTGGKHHLQTTTEAKGKHCIIGELSEAAHLGWFSKPTARALQRFADLDIRL